MTPAEVVVSEFRGVRTAPRALGLAASTITRWSYPVEKGGQGGNVPGKHHQNILAVAKERRLKIVLRDLWHGRKEQE